MSPNLASPLLFKCCWILLSTLNQTKKKKKKNKTESHLSSLIFDAVSPACMWSTKRSAWGRCASRTSTGKVRVQPLEKLQQRVWANKRHRSIFCALQPSDAENCLGGPSVLRDRRRGMAVTIAVATPNRGQTWPDATTGEDRDQI